MNNVFNIANIDTHAEGFGAEQPHSRSRLIVSLHHLAFRRRYLPVVSPNLHMVCGINQIINLIDLTPIGKISKYLLASGNIFTHSLQRQIQFGIFDSSLNFSGVMALNIERNIASLYIPEMDNSLSQTEFVNCIIYNIVITRIYSRGCQTQYRER